MKKFSIFIIIFLLFYSCATLNENLFKQKPTAKIEKVDITSISFNDITLLFDVKIENPYPVDIKLHSISTIFKIWGNKLFESESLRGVKIPANKSTNNTFNVVLNYSDIIKIISDYKKYEFIDCEIEGIISIAIPETGIPSVPEKLNFPYKLEKKIPALKPSLKIKDITIIKPSTDQIKDAVLKSAKKIDFMDALNLVDRLIKGNYDEAFKIIKPEELDLKFNVDFKIELFNETKFKINFDYLKYALLLNNDRLVEGESKEINTLENKTVINVRSVVSLKDFSRTIVTCLKERIADFNLKGESSIKLPSEFRAEPLKFVFDEKGKSGIIIK